MYEFEILHQNEIVTRVCLSDDKKQVIKLNRICKKPVKQPLLCESRNDISYVYDFLKSRCYQDDYSGLPEILEKMGLNSNDPYHFVEKTHGIKRKDFLWIRFPGEALTWEKVRGR